MTASLKTFGSLGAFAEHIISNALKRQAILQDGLHKAAEAVVKIAKSEVGEYQPAIGPFLEWEQLAESTEEDKARQGYREDAPLERTGELRESYRSEVHGLEAIAGSTDPVAYWQEVGTPHIPPREVIGPAAIRAKKKIQKAIGDSYAESLLLQPPP